MPARASSFRTHEGDDAHTATQPLLRPCSPADKRRFDEAIAAGFPFLVWRDSDGSQRIFVLGAEGRLTIGRRASCHITLEDDLVSRVHAALEPIAGDWALLDDGISRNGTFVNGNQIVSRRLADGDRLRFGQTEMTYRRPRRMGSALTTSASSLSDARTLTEAQRAVLAALARPYRREVPLTAPASNGAIAKEVGLSLDAVKGHLDVLFRRFEIAEPTGAQRRVRLVECALQWDLIAESDLT